jgi:hypothetical protein
MLDLFFEPKYRAAKDAREVRDLALRYGDNLKTILSERARDNSLRERDRKHWRRLLKKIPQV